MAQIGYAAMLEQFHPKDLIGFCEKAEAAGFSLKFACPRKPVRELLELTNLVSVFDAYTSVAEAMAALAHEEVCSA